MAIKSISQTSQDYGSPASTPNEIPKTKQTKFVPLKQTYSTPSDSKINSLHDLYFVHNPLFPESLLSTDAMNQVAEGICLAESLIGDAIYNLISRVMEAVKEFFHFIASFLPMNSGKQLVKELFVANDTGQFNRDFERCVYTINGKPANQDQLLTLLGENGRNLLVQTLATDININLRKKMKPGQDITNFAKTAYSIEDLGSSIKITAEFPLAIKGEDEEENLAIFNFILVSRTITISKEDLKQTLNQKQRVNVDELLAAASHQRDTAGGVVEKATQRKLRQELMGFAPSLSISDSIQPISAEKAFKHSRSTLTSTQGYEKYTLMGDKIIENENPTKKNTDFD